MDLHEEVPRLAILLAGALARLGQHLADAGTGRAEAHRRTQRAQARGQPGCLGPRRGPLAEAHRLAVAELAGVRVPGQRVRAPDHAGVGVGHDERPQPAQLRVVHGGRQLVLVAQVRLGVARGAQGVGISQERTRCRVGGDHRGDLLHRGDGAAGERALHVADEQRRVAEPASGLVEHQDAEVRGDRVEPARVHDPGARRASRLVGGVDRGAHEQHLAGQVHVVGSGLRAGLDQWEAVAHVRPDGRGHGRGRARQLGDGGAIGRVDEHQGPLGCARSKRLADGGELGQ